MELPPRAIGTGHRHPAGFQDPAHAARQQDAVSDGPCRDRTYDLGIKSGFRRTLRVSAELPKRLAYAVSCLERRSPSLCLPAPLVVTLLSPGPVSNQRLLI